MMDDTIETRALRDVEAFPFTNLTRILRHAGRAVPDAIGGGCVWMAARLARLLRERRADMAVHHYDLGSAGSHMMTVSDDGTERLLYEPSFFQVRPFSLTRFAADSQHCTSATFPPDPSPMKLHFAWESASVLRVDFLSRRGSVQRTLPYAIKTPVTVNEDDPYQGLPLIERQDHVYLHVLNPDFSKTTLLVNTRTKRINVGRLWERLYVDSEPGFNGRFEALADRLNLSAKQFRSILGDALDIHDSHDREF